MLFTKMQSLITALTGTVLPLVMSLAVLFFIWGLVRFLMDAGNEEHEEGKNIMLWGMIALFVMVALWSILAYIETSLGITGTENLGNAPGTPSGPVPNLGQGGGFWDL